MILAILGLHLPEILVLAAVGLFSMLLLAIPALLAYLVLRRIPEAYRLQRPELAFLLVIPIFVLAWNFFVFPRIARSLRACFVAHGDGSVGTCGEGLALGYCLCALFVWVPFVNRVAGPAALILLILFLAKAFDLTGRIPAQRVSA